MLLDEGDETLVRLRGGDVPRDEVLPDEERDLVRAPADVAEVGVGHLAGSVHDAPHDGDLETLEVRGPLLDAARRLLEIEQSAPARRAGDELRLRGAHARPLEDVEGERP